MTPNKIILIVGGIAVVAIAVLLGSRFFGGPTVSPTPTPTPTSVSTSTPLPTATLQNVEGKISNISANNRRVTITDQNNKEINLVLTGAVKITDKNGKSVDFSYLRKGYTIQANGALNSDNILEAAEVKILEEPNIIVFSPQSNDEIGLPLVIDGEARVFENNLNYRLKDQNNEMLVENFTTANAPDIGQYGLFHVEANYPAPKGTVGTLEVFDYSARDGSEIDKVTIAVRFKKVSAMTVKVFFGNQRLDPQVSDCNKVFAVNRRIPQTQSVARAALTELLKGPTSDEGRNGYFSSINPGVKIQKLTITNGVARVDFDATLEQSVGGSCRVAAIRAEITQTLKQFSTVKSVIISINGRTEDILQP